MISYDTKLKIKELFLSLAEDEIVIEKLRQMLATIKDFEPYAAFKRIDRESTGFITCKSLSQFIKENGFRELNKEDFVFMVRYFDQDGDQKLNYHDFLQILLPCDDAVLRAAATQRPNFQLGKNDFLPMRVERALTQLLAREVKLHLKAENLKRSLESSYDFNIQNAFKSIDDWSYNYIDEKNLRRFLRNVGHLASKQELVSIIRRFDTDGDAKINFEEFSEGIRSQLSQQSSSSVTKKTKVNTHNTSQMGRSGSKGELKTVKNTHTPQKQTKSFMNTPSKRQTPVRKSGQKIERKRPQSANKVYGGYNQRQQLLNSIYSNTKQDDDSTPSKMNKSVTFNSQVRVREYDNSQDKSAKTTPFRITEQKNDISQSYSYSGNSYNNMTPSPLKDQSVRRNLDYQPAILNISNASPLKPSNQSTIEKQNRYNQMNGSPLVTKMRTPIIESPNILSYSQSSEKLKMSHLEQQTNSQQSGTFDRIEQGEVAKIFKDTIFLERELESAKIELTLKPDFNLKDAFRMVDVQGKGFVTASEIAENLKSSLLMDGVSKDDVYLFFRRYDVNSSGRIKFSEFCTAFTTLSKEYASLLIGRPDFYSSKNLSPSEYFSIETRNEIRNAWKTIFQTERASECLRARIARRPHFSIKSAFNYCDRDHDGVIVSNDIRDMLADHGFFATERELNSIMAKLDKDKDSKITFSEYVDELSPKLSL